ncbi:MAG: dihydroneopterin aldolase [Halieaceae bacterium]|jgi:dihydroneopterin aldolase|nr:dihydroneopterin aldolase [Halieaceae bacterium]
MDRVYLRDLAIDAIIGIHPWEREVRQTLVLQVELAADTARAAASNAIADAVDYSAVAERLTALVQQGRYELLERLAEDAAAMLLSDFDVAWVRLQVGKPGAVAAAGEVGVVIERGNPPS